MQSAEIQQIASEYAEKVCFASKSFKYCSFVSINQIELMMIHHNLVITRLLGSETYTVLVKQPCYIQAKMYRLYRKMRKNEHAWSFFYIIYAFLGVISKIVL